MNTPALVPQATLHAAAAPHAPIAIAIDRLVLDGIAPPRGGERVLRGALTRELARLFANGGIADALRGGAALPRLDLDALPLPEAPRIRMPAS